VRSHAPVPTTPHLEHPVAISLFFVRCFPVTASSDTTLNITPCAKHQWDCRNLDWCYKKKQGDLRLKITREEHDHIMGVAHQMNDESETYLFDSPSSLMFQRNAEGMLVCSRVASPSGISRDEILMNRDICAPEDETPESFAGVEMRQDSSFPPGAVTPSPTRTTQSHMSPLLNGAHDTTQKILLLFHSVEELYKDMPAKLNRLSDGLAHFLEQAIDRRRVQLRSVEGVKRKAEQRTGEIQEGVAGVPTGSKRKVNDLFPATERALKSKCLRPACEVSRKNAPPSRKTVLTIHSQSNKNICFTLYLVFLGPMFLLKILHAFHHPCDIIAHYRVIRLKARQRRQRKGNSRVKSSELGAASSSMVFCYPQDPRHVGTKNHVIGRQSQSLENNNFHVWLACIGGFSVRLLDSMLLRP